MNVDKCFRFYIERNIIVIKDIDKKKRDCLCLIKYKSNNECSKLRLFYTFIFISHNIIFITLYYNVLQLRHNIDIARNY